jgi:dTDP-3-amino-3,4,6-trideoxy-alpha-D-glucose transaminase
MFSIVIPQAAPRLRIERYREEIDEAVARVLGSGLYILGPTVERFEQAFAAWLGVKHCVGVSSGTDALSLALRALGIGPNEEVITASLTAAGTGLAILHCGARPCFVDVDPTTCCLDPRAVEAAISPRTAAIVPVHLFGQPADMPVLLEIAARHRIAVVEDCAQAHGATIAGRRVGGFGNLGAFSFYPTKNLGAIGDAGAVATNDASLAARVRALRCYGWQGSERISALPGFNARLDELQAAILTVLLRHTDEGNRERRMLAAAYRQSLDGAGVGLPHVDAGAVYHQFTITSNQRDVLAEYLRAKQGIETAVHYFPALHQQPAFLSPGQAPLPVTERLARQLLSLPIQPEVATPHVARIAEAVRKGINRWKAS